MAFDRNANTLSRLRRNAQRMKGDGITAAVLVTAPLVNSGSSISLSLDASGGLENNSGSLRVKLNGTSLSQGTSGLAVATSGITTAMIQGDAVTFAKMQNIPTDSLIGRDAAGSGDPGQIGVTGGIEFDGANQIRVGAFTGDVTKTAGGTVLTLANVNGNVGTFNNLTVNAKGLVTGASNVAYLTGNQTITLSGAVTGSGATSITTTYTLAASGGLEDASGLKLKGFPTQAGDPATPADGDVWYDTTDRGGRQRAGSATLALGGVIYASPSESSAIANTTAETDFDRSFTLPANFLTVGRVLRVYATGRHSTTGTPTLRLQIKVGGLNILAVGAVNTVNNASNRAWIIEGTLRVETVGAAVPLKGGGFTTLNTGTDAFALRAAGNLIDTTAAQDVTVSAQWGTASASNTAVMESLVIEAY